MRNVLLGFTLVVSLLVALPSWGQATARPCAADETPGPACLLVRKSLPTLPAAPLYWHLDRFASKNAAIRASVVTSTEVEAFGSIWLFTIERKDWRAKGGEHVDVVGPLPLEPAPNYTAEYLRSVFSPGMKAPLHVHSGPEAFYAISGDTCLETPDGVQLAHGGDHGLVLRGGPPMLLMAIGKEPRRGFALILHDATQPPTTLIQDWQPKGLCEQRLSASRAP